MNEKIKVGSIVTGKVTGIQPYGAFLSLGDNVQGLIHISEITNGYVKDIRDYIKVGEELDVKILSVDFEKGKISLSLKAVEDMRREEKLRRRKEQKRAQLEHMAAPANKGFNTLREKLEEWIEQSSQEQMIEK